MNCSPHDVLVPVPSRAVGPDRVDPQGGSR